MTFKKTIYHYATLLSALFLTTMLLSSCGAKSQSADYAMYDMAPEDTAQTETIENNIVINNDNTLNLNTKATFKEGTVDKGIILKMSDGQNLYIITTESALTSNLSSITLSIEDNLFNLQKYTVTAPDNYVMTDVRNGDTEYNTFDIISNSTLFNGNPDLLQITYHVVKFKDEVSTPYIVSQFFAIDGGTLKKLDIYDKTTDNSKTDDFVKYSVLYPTEAYTYMEPVEFEINDNVYTPDIYTYKIDFDRFIMTKTKQDFSPDNPLYFAYGYFALANSVYRYYDCDVYNIDDSAGFFEDPVVDSNSGNYKYSNFYFLVDDERFGNLEELIDYTNTIFSDDITKLLLKNAPQRYRDFDGRLHTLNNIDKSKQDTGLMIITDVKETENGFVFTTVKQCFDKNNVLCGYEDSGDLVLELQEGTDDIGDTEQNDVNDSEEQQHYSMSPYGYVFTKYNNVVQKDLS